MKLGANGHLLLENRFNYFANNRRQTDGPELFWLFCARCFCNKGNDGEAPVIRNLGNLKREVKNAEKGWSFVGSRGFKNFGKESIRAGSLIGVEGSLDF